ncbi:MAG: HlyD family efflux transporter periplasmic adaptor subunit [Microcystaceae cyanobacterium]
MTNRLSPSSANSNGKATTEDDGTLSEVKETAIAPKSAQVQVHPGFFGTEQSVLLRQSSVWSRGVIWGIISVTVIAIVWANLATIEEVIPATGQIKPQDTVKDIQAPVNGVVKEVLVKNNESVKKGQVLVILDSTTTLSDLESARKIKQATLQENAFYRSVLQEGVNPSQIDTAILQLKLPWEVVALAKNRVTLIQENKLYQALLNNQQGIGKLPPEQESRLKMAQFELRSRELAAQMDIQQLEKQLTQADGQLTSAKTQLADDKFILKSLLARNKASIGEAAKSLEIEKGILGSVKPLLEEGALAKLQVEKQQQSINDRYQKIIQDEANGSVEFDKQRQQIQTREAEINRLQEDQKRIMALIGQAKARLVNTTAVTEKELYDRMADNTKKLADIDSQLTKVIVDNNKKISELESQISRAQVTLKYQAIKAPVNGTVFDLKATPGYVTPPNQTEPLLKLVPDDYFIAQVDVTNKDIGFVRKGMSAEVRIDSFPYSEFGDIKGKIETIGSDALPPDQINQQYRFPVRIKLDQQYLKTEDRKITLQSGMSITANLKVREKRTVMSLFSELFTKKIESLETVR